MCETMHMDMITWAAIGCGDVMERKSGPPLYELPGSRLYGVTRRNRERGEDFARRHHTTFFADLASLVNDPNVDAVYVATPPEAHEEGTLAAAAAGKHVMVEKEMAPDAGACGRMVAACREAGVVLGVAFYRRCYPSVLRARELVADGAIGRLRRLAIGDGFPLSHRIDLGHFVLGDFATAQRVDGPLPTGSAPTPGPGLLARAQDDGCEFHTRADWDGGDRREVLTFIGATGSLEVTDLKAGCLRLERTGRAAETIDVGPLPWCHWGLFDNFNRHLRGMAELACDGEEGRKSTVILDQLARLPADGSPVSIDYR